MLSDLLISLGQSLVAVGQHVGNQETALANMSQQVEELTGQNTALRQELEVVDGEQSKLMLRVQQLNTALVRVQADAAYAPAPSHEKADTAEPATEHATDTTVAEPELAAEPEHEPVYSIAQASELARKFEPTQSESLTKGNDHG